MKKKWISLLCILGLVLSMAGCSGEETTLTGMVVSLDGTTLTVMEMSGSMEDFSGGRPDRMEGFTMPEGMEDYTRPEGMENFDPENFNPENMPEGFDPENMPEGFAPGNMPQGFGPGMFGGSMPEGGERPEQFEGGERPEMPQDGSFSGMGDPTTVDIADAHISLEIDGGKASGSVDDLAPGAFVTITLNARGQATYVLVTQSFGFGGMFMSET